MGISSRITFICGITGLWKSAPTVWGPSRYESRHKGFYFDAKCVSYFFFNCDTSYLTSISYLEKAKQDRQVYRDLLDPILASIGRPKDLVTQDEVETFCKNSRYLKATFGSNLNQIAQGNFKESDYCKLSSTLLSLLSLTKSRF